MTISLRTLHVEPNHQIEGVCARCRGRVVWYLSAHAKRWIPFDPEPTPLLGHWTEADGSRGAQVVGRVHWFSCDGGRAELDQDGATWSPAPSDPIGASG